MAEQNAEKMASLDLNAEGTDAKDEDFVDPWNVQSSSETGVDYAKLIGTQFYLLYMYKETELLIHGSI